MAKIEALRAAGQIDEALDDGLELVRNAVANPGHRVVPALAFLSRFIAEHVDAPGRQATMQILGKRAGSILLHGLGTASFGPVDRYLFHISGDVGHLERAIEVADRAGVKLWQVLLRAEFAAAVPGEHKLMLRQAKRFTTDTELGPLLELWG